LALKFTVYSLGAILIGGTLLLGGLIYQRNKNPLPTEAVTTSSGKCSTAPLTLNTDAPIASTSQNGEIVTMLTEKNGGGDQQLILINYCSGEVLRRITIKR
jgi:hypothetical protein